MADQAATRPRGDNKSFAVELLEVLLLAVGLYAAITFAIQTVHVMGYSMVPTLQDNDYLVATKIDLRFTTPQRGDIIILRDPENNSQDFIKRVIALPGEDLSIVDSKVYIDGRLLVEPYLAGEEPWVANNNWPGPLPNHSATKIPPDSYFVMGDNRNHSSDSRRFGPIHRDRIDSRAWVRILPLDKASALNQRPYFQSGAG